MAIQQLTQPILNPIVAFDATKVHTIDFIVIGGAQVIGNRLVISDNQTGEQIYDKVQSTMKLEHSIPANILKNGGYYNAVIYTIDSGGNESVASTAVPFYCYSQPVLTIDNIPATETIENGTYAFTGSYLQQENEPLNSYQYILYDSNRNILTQSDLIYYEANNSLSYTFVGMSNDTSYYVELIGQTINGTKVTSGLRYFTVRYLQPASFAICDLVNNCEDGYIQISSNIVAIDGKSNPDPPIYIDDKEVDLREPGSWVEWDEGFRIQDDFTMRVWGRDFNPYEEIITLTNDLNSDSKPNKIVLKWMIGDVIKSLPDYTNISDFNVNMQDSQSGAIEDLMIGGNSLQKSSNGEEIVNDIQPVSFITPFSKKISILPGGVSTQETRSGKNLTNYQDWIDINSNSTITSKENNQIITTIKANGYGVKDIQRQLKPNTKYTFYALINFTGNYGSTYGVRIKINDSYTSYSTNGLVNFTTDETGLVNILIYAGVPYTGENATLTVSDIRLYEGTYTIDNIPDYEQYGTSPSPEYPSKIQNVGDNINLFNKETAENDKYINSSTGEVKGLTGTSASDYIDIKGLKEIILSGDDIVRTNGGAFYNSSKEYISGFATTEIWNGIDIPETANYVRVTVTTEKLNNIKIEKGKQPTSYSPYNCGNVDITVCNKNLVPELFFQDGSKIKTLNGITAQILQDNKIKISGTATERVQIYFKAFNLKIYGKQNYQYISNSIGYDCRIEFRAKVDDNTVYLNSYNNTPNNNMKCKNLLELGDAYIVISKGQTIDNTFYFFIQKENENITYVEHEEQIITFPLLEGQKLMKGDYLADDGIHHKRKQIVLTGEEDGWAWADTTRYALKIDNAKDGNGLCNQFKYNEYSAIGKIDNTFNITNGYVGFYITSITSLRAFKNYLAEQYANGTPVVVEYDLAEEEIEPYTEEQQEAYNKLTNISSYSGENNVYSLINLPIPITVVTSIIPSPNNPSKIYSLGDRVNLINLNDFNITYNQQYSEDTNTNFILYPNYIYTLSFDYNVNNTTTDLYFSVGYGKDSYENDISSESQYLNLYSGRNTVSFIVPDTINAGDYLWIKFAQTIILADVDVEISNIQLEKGFFATDYKSPNIYTIYPTSVQKNLYNYKTPIYIINNNTQYTDIQNGYSITLKKDNINSSFVIGYKGILNANDTYAISYNYTGNLESFKLYITDKESQKPIDEISLNNGVFQAPEGVYDLQLVFNIDSNNINNYLELWNIQIEANDTISEYEPYNSKELTFDTEEQLLSSGDNVRDLVALKSPNILNSKTQSGATIPSTKYYLNQAGNTEYHIWYYNNEGNLIVFIDPDGHEASGVVGIRGAFTVHSECTKVTITKSSDPDANDVSQEEIESNQIIISKGDSPIEYYPYFDVPSRVQKVAKKIFNGTESWAISGTEDIPYIYVSDIKPSTMNAICTDYRISDRFKLSDGLFGVSSSKNIVFYNSNYVNKLDEWKTYLTERYNSDNPIVLEYELNTPIVTPLTQDEIEGLSGLLSYDGITNIYTNNDVLGYNTFNYISSYSEQQTQNAYLQLKCYNANTLYYFIHSNYIEIPEDTSKVFIWLRRKNNLFDLKIEDLGDYKEEDHPTDITKPVVTLDINLNDITQSEIPVTATCIDETGLRTVRFSKDNGISWDEVIPVDGLSTNNSYVFKNLSADTFYTIRVEAIDLSGNIGGMSQRVTTKA